MKSVLITIGYVLLIVVFLSWVIWQTNAWYNYPCEAWQTGHLSIGNLPGRCGK